MGDGLGQAGLVAAMVVAAMSSNQGVWGKGHWGHTSRGSIRVGVKVGADMI